MTRRETSGVDLQAGGQYLQQFGHLETLIRRIMQVDERVEFSKVLRDFRLRLPTFGIQLDVIEDLTKLRNLIAHGNERVGKVIPTVETTQALNDAIAAVEGLTENLARFFKTVREFVPGDSLEAVLAEMDKYQFSQVVVRDNSRINVATAIDITEWLASQAAEGIVSIEDATVHDVLKNRRKALFVVMSRNTTIALAAEAFVKAATTDYNNLFCILITQNGKPTESPLGIITLWDLLHVPKLMHNSVQPF
jgi:predicted transcriptional regulator